jgi:hypothetical protein
MERCASCDEPLEEDDEVAQLESADLLCMSCMGDLGDAFDTEVAKNCLLRDIHPDWRT